MGDPIDLKNLMRGFEEKIEKRFGSHRAYKQVKAALEKKGAKPDPMALIMDSKAMFSGNNKPSILVTEAVTALEKQIESRSGAMLKAFDKKKKVVANNIEKNRAFLENRASNIVHDVNADEALFAGRLIVEEGAKPVAGAKIIVRTSGADAKVVAEAVTDANGEYVIKMGADEVKKATKTLTFSFETADGHTIAKSKKATLATAKGSTKVVDVTVSEKNIDLVSKMVETAEKRKSQALLEMSELKKTEAELNMIKFRTKSSSDKIRKKLAEIRSLFD